MDAERYVNIRRIVKETQEENRAIREAGEEMALMLYRWHDVVRGGDSLTKLEPWARALIRETLPILTRWRNVAGPSADTTNAKPRE